MRPLNERIGWERHQKTPTRSVGVPPPMLLLHFPPVTLLVNSVGWLHKLNQHGVEPTDLIKSWPVSSDSQLKIYEISHENGFWRIN